MLTIQEQEKVELHIANNQMDYDVNIYSAFEAFVEGFRGKVYRYGTVNPQEFMDKLDIYIYPFHHEAKTFNVPLTLLEASFRGVEIIGPDHNNVKCWFPEENCINPKCASSILSSIKIIMNRDSTKLDSNVKSLVENVKIIKVGR